MNGTTPPDSAAPPAPHCPPPPTPPIAAQDRNGRPTGARPTPPARLALLLIRGYQRLLSPLLPPSCRFVPSCSQYGYEAVAKYGIIRGGALGAWRILRCNPFGRGGYDPVP